MHVVFDMDGVLLDSESDLSWFDRALDRTLEEFGLDPTPENHDLLCFTNIRNFDSAAAELDVPPEDLWPVRQRNYVREKRTAIVSGEIGPYDDLDELRALSSHVPISIISNSPTSIVETFVETAAIDDVIDHCIGRGTDRSSLGDLKPARTLFDRLDERTDGQEYVYVGDSRTDEQFAKRTGMEFIYLDREGGDVSSLRDVRNRICSRL